MTKHELIIVVVAATVNQLWGRLFSHKTRIDAVSVAKKIGPSLMQYAFTLELIVDVVIFVFLLFKFFTVPGPDEPVTAGSVRTQIITILLALGVLSSAIQSWKRARRST